MRTVTLDDRGRITIPHADRAALGLASGESLMFERTDNGFRLAKLAEVGRITRAVLDEIKRDRGVSLTELIERDGVDVEKELRDVTFE